MDVTGLLVFLLLGLPTLILAVLREFHHVNVVKNWTESQSYCREKFGDLATAQTAEEIYIRELLLGELRDFNCEATQLSVCYDETSNSYIPVANAMTWQSAQSFCRQTHTDLASIRNQQELNDIMSVVDPTGRNWVGFSRDRWKWSDQSDSSLILWRSDQPDSNTQTCGFATTTGLSNGWCDFGLPFICAAPQRKVLKVTLKTDGSVNLNDPLVQEAVLKQMEKDLRGQGLHQEFSLTWKKQPQKDVFNKTEL